MELLRRSCRELGQTVIVVTHDPRAASYADRVVFLRDGRIATEVRFAGEASLQQNLKTIIEQMEQLEF
jgi:putative ABC transport system ATP-binding protein